MISFSSCGQYPDVQLMPTSCRWLSGSAHWKSFLPFLFLSRSHSSSPGARCYSTLRSPKSRNPGKFGENVGWRCSRRPSRSVPDQPQRQTVNHRPLQSSQILCLCIRTCCSCTLPWGGMLEWLLMGHKTSVL